MKSSLETRNNGEMSESWGNHQWAKICLQHIYKAEGVNGEVFAGRQATKAKVNAHSQ